MLAPNVAGGFENAKIAKTRDLIRKEQRPIFHITIAIVDSIHQRADDHAYEPRMGLQHLEIECDEDIGI
jgi:hypothetical protein